METKLYLEVDQYLISEDDEKEYSICYLEIDKKRWLRAPNGNMIAGKSEQRWGAATIGFSSMLQVPPFALGWFSMVGDKAIGVHNSPETDLSEYFPGNVILEESIVRGGTHIIAKTRYPKIVAEMVFLDKYDGLPSTINLFPFHEKIKLEDPSKNTRHLTKSKIEWTKLKSGWFVSHVVVDSVNGPPTDVVKCYTDAKWEFESKINPRVFDPPIPIGEMSNKK
jgi:hypothetical protein